MTATRQPRSRGLKAATVACAMAAAMGTATQAEAQEGLGYTDLRLSINTLPWDGFKGGPVYNPVQGSYDSGIRISGMIIGPICGILPVGCGTPARPADSVSGSSDIYGGYDDLNLEDEVVFYDAGVSYDLLVGFELSGIMLANDGELNPLSGIVGMAFEDPVLYSLTGGGIPGLNPALGLAFGAGEPDISVTALAGTLHFGWGFELVTRTSGRFHVEITPFLGAGMGVADWTDGLSGADDDRAGIYYEVGARAGAYYTWNNGMQLGLNARWMYGDLDVDLFNTGTNLSVSGLTIGLDLGYRF